MENNMEKILDLVIAGAGPAGISAGIYAARAELDFIIVEKMSVPGGQIVNTYDVDNYPGIPEISGFDLSVKFKEHAKKLGADFMQADIDFIRASDEIADGRTIFETVLKNGTIIKSKTVLVASGAVNKKLGVEGEEKYTGTGVSYCAVCDGAFFRNKTAAVIGGGDVALEDALFLSRLCSKVYLIHRRKEFRAAKSLVSKVLECDNIEIIYDSIAEKINGEKTVKSISIKNVISKEIKEIETNGVFIAVGTAPESGIVKGLVNIDETGSIIAGEDTLTSMPGIFAAGDVRTKQLRQVITAAADGANAIASIEKYLI